jgi:hypothetical protein
MEPITQFLWGVAGSLTAEIPCLDRASRSGRSLPKRFRQASYWLVRLLVAVVAGLLAVATSAPTPLFAMSLGAATPLLLEQWQKRIPRSGDLTKE